MDARSRYLTIYDDLGRKVLDRVPTNVQYIKEDFIEKYKDELTQYYKYKLYNKMYFDIPLILGFDSVFAPFPLSYRIKSIKLLNENGEEIKIGADGQKIKQKTNYYEGGYIASLDILRRSCSSSTVILSISE